MIQLDGHQHTALTSHTRTSHVLGTVSPWFLPPLFLKTNLDQRSQWDKLQLPSLQLDLGPHLVLTLSLFHYLRFIHLRLLTQQGLMAFMMGWSKALFLCGPNTWLWCYSQSGVAEQICSWLQWNKGVWSAYTAYLGSIYVSFLCKSSLPFSFSIVTPGMKEWRLLLTCWSLDIQYQMLWGQGKLIPKWKFSCVS